jgi:hypothetical protein
VLGGGRVAEHGVVRSWTVPMGLLEVGGLRIAYERAGSGPALVLLHGYVADGPTT